MSSQDVQHVGKAQGLPSESSSFLKWLVASVIIVALAAGAAIGVRYLPTENPNDTSTLSFPVPKKRAGPPGKIVLDESPTYVFGVMPQRSKGTHTWTFKNGGEGVLELSKGPSTCSCTIANFKSEKDVLVLEPGKSTEINLTWETREFDGKFEKSATINVVGDADRSQVIFAVEGTVKPSMAIMPKERTLSFGDVPNDASRKVSFALASSDMPEFKILTVTSSQPDAFNIETVPLPDDERQQLNWTTMTGGFKVNVELKPSKELGSFNEEIIVTTDHPKVAEIRLSAGGRRSGPVSIVPQVVQMHNIAPADGGVQTLMVIVRNGEDTTLEVLDAPENVKVEIASADLKSGSAVKVRQFRVTVTVPPGTPSGVISGEITLKSNHPRAERLKIPVDISVLSSN